MSIKTETRSLRCGYTVIRTASVVKLIAGFSAENANPSVCVGQSGEQPVTFIFIFLAKQKKRSRTKTVWRLKIL